jgi:hypothetical protein
MNLREMGVITRIMITRTTTRLKKLLLLTQQRRHVLLLPRGVCRCQQLLMLMDTEAVTITIRTIYTLTALIAAHQLLSTVIVTVALQLQLTTTNMVGIIFTITITTNPTTLQRISITRRLQ